MSPGSAHRELKRLAESGLLLREPVGNQVRYRANRDCSIYPELAGVFRKTTGLSDVLRGALTPLASDIDFAFVFGSIAQGKERVTSDVDVFLIGSASFTGVVSAFAGIPERLGREVNPVVMRRRDFIKKRAEGDRFVTRILKETKIFLIGTANDLGKLTEDRAVKESRH